MSIDMYIYINISTNQSINHSINQSINQSVSQSNQSINQSTNQFTSHYITSHQLIYLSSNLSLSIYIRRSYYHVPLCLSMSFHVYLFLSMPMFLLFNVHLVFNPSRYLSICAFVHPSIYLSNYLPIHLSTVPIYISSCIAIYLSTYSLLSYSILSPNKNTHFRDQNVPHETIHQRNNEKLVSTMAFRFTILQARSTRPVSSRRRKDNTFWDFIS